MRKKRLLLVAEEAGALTSVSGLLDAAGYEVTTASSVGEALAMIDGNVPDLILLDGAEGAGEISSREETRRIPLVLIAELVESSGGNPPPGIRRIIYKPCRPRTLIEGVESALRYGPRGVVEEGASE